MAMLKLATIFIIFLNSQVGIAQEFQRTDIDTTKTATSSIQKNENSFKLTSSLRVPIISNENHMMPMIGAAFANTLTTIPLDYDIGFETMIFAHKVYGQLKYVSWYSPYFTLFTGVESDIVVSNTDLINGGFSMGPTIEVEFEDLAVQLSALGSRWDDFDLSMRVAYKL